MIGFPFFFFFPFSSGDGLEFNSSSQIQVIAGIHLNSLLCFSPIERETCIHFK